MDLWILSLFISLSLRPKELACIELVRAEHCITGMLQQIIIENTYGRLYI
jgi:hypothetical protein